MPIKIAINGFGRIGQAVCRRILDKHPGLQIAAVNDLADKDTLLHLFKHDSLYGVNNKRIGAVFFAEKEPRALPWKKMGIDIVLECTGKFTDLTGARKHLQAGAKKVIISAPAKSTGIPTYLPGVNEQEYDKRKDKIVSMGSCTTNALAPVAKILDKELGIVQGFMTTVHSYTTTQNILDGPHKDLRRARAAAINIVPTTTGAAKTVEKCLPGLKGKLNGIALRVPVPVVSVVDFVCQVAKPASAKQVNAILKTASGQGELKGILAVEAAPLVSADYIGNSFSAIVDAPSTMAIDNLVKVLVWYDNEWGYACRLAEFTKLISM